MSRVADAAATQPSATPISASPTAFASATRNPFGITPMICAGTPLPVMLSVPRPRTPMR
jgi:hypothetical protein